MLPQTVQVVSALEALSSSLVDVSTLYGEYADVFDLPECKLAIVHCAGHFDPTLIENLWREIVEKGVLMLSLLLLLLLLLFPLTLLLLLLLLLLLTSLLYYYYFIIFFFRE